MIKRLFLDESGECSFIQSSSFKHFVIAVAAIDDTDNKTIKHRLKQVFKKFRKRGWYKTKEIKASDLYRNRKFGAESVKEVIRTLLKIKSLEISYFVVNKAQINNESFRKASHGIGYNYFAGVLLSEMIFKNNYHNLFLIHDVRNKETHSKMHFSEYLKTKIYGTALEKGVSVGFEIKGFASDECYGLLAVDFLSWAIYRKFEYSDNQFYNMLEGKFKRKTEWYLEN